MVLVQLSATVLRRAQDLLLRHPLRAADALQLGSCLDLKERLQQPVGFAAFDRRLNEAAKLEGLRVAP